MTLVGRTKLDHPALSTAGGSALHASIEAIYTAISDHLGGRYKAYSAQANGTTVTYEHNYGVAFSELTVLVYTGTHPTLTRVSDPVGAGWTIAANPSNPNTQVNVTVPASGGPHTFAIFVVQGRTITPLSISNADIAAAAGIVDTKLATISTAGKVLNSATTATSDNTPSAIVARDSSGNFSAGTITANVTGNCSGTAASFTGNLTGDVTSTGMATTIASGAVTNTKVSNTAAIAGTKISPDFGSQNVTTTGSLSGTNVVNAGYEEFTQIATPSNPAASKVRVYAKSDGKLYRLDNAGNETAVGSGSGSGGVNYLVDWFDATKAVGTVSTVAVGGNVAVSGSFPAVTSAWYADVTSGSAAIASSSNNALRGTTNYLTALSGASTAGATFVQSPVFNIDGEDLGKALTVQFDVSGNTTDDDWDVVAVRYNSSGVFQELIPIAGNASSMTATPSAKLPIGVKTFNGFFITSSTASDVYAIRWRRRNGTSAIRLDSLTVGPQQVLQGAIVTDWQSYTPTLTNVNSSANVSFKYRRIGSDIEINGKFQTTSASPSTSTLTIGLPSGLTIDSNAVSDFALLNQYGTVSLYILSTGLTQTNKFSVALESATGGTSAFVLTQSVGAARVRESDLGQNNYVEVNARIPVSSWTSNTQQAARAVEEYAANDGTSNIYGPAGTSIAVAIAAGGATRTVTWQTPQLPTDKIELEVDLDGVGRWVSLPAGSQAIQASSGALIGAYNTSTDVGVIVVPSATNNTQCEVRFRQYRNATTSWTTLTNGRWRLRKVSSGAAVGFPIAPANITLIDNSDNYGGNTKLGLMQYVSGTNYNGGISPTLSGTGLATTRGVFVPYQMSDGTWRLKFNFRVTATSTTGLTVTINGVTFKNVSNYFQSVSNFPGGNYGRGNVTPNTGQISLSSDLSTTTWAASGDVELESKPTWAY